MCIVSLVNFKNGDFILTHNRDENVFRPATDKIESRTVQGKKIQCPVDLESNGTWIFSSEKYICCILNGEFKKHKRELPYKKSRGQLILDVLNFDSINDFIEQSDFNKIEPFTLFLLDLETKEQKILVWDSKVKHVQNVSDSNLVVRSSSTLYSDKEKELNLQSIQNIEPNPDNLIEIHNQIKMPENERYPNIRTTSITQIEFKNQSLKMRFSPIS